MSARLVLDRHRPTLAELLAPHPAWVRVLLAAVVVLAAGALLALKFWPDDDPEVYVHRSAPPFNFTYDGDRLRQRPVERDELVALAERRGSLFVQSFAVRSVELPRYEGDSAAILPLVAEGELEELRERHREFELVGEGKTRINEVPGYQIVFRARLGERLLLGRVVLLAEPVPGSRRAVALEMLGTPVSGVTDPRDVGGNAVLKQPYRSFRFGSERP